MDGYDRGGHTKYSMKAHLIFVTKYRKKIFANASTDEDVKQFLYETARRIDVGIVKMETDKDHVHMLIAYHPRMSVSSIVKVMKEYSTYHMWQAHGQSLRRCYWKRKVLWSDGYFACSIGQVSQKVIEQYIDNQG